MNARFVSPARVSLAGQAMYALMKVRLSTRVLMLAMSALLGAILYLIVNWPGRQAPVFVSSLPQPPAVVALAPQVSPAAVVPTSSAGAAGSLIVDAARGVAAAADPSLTARSIRPASAAVAPVVAARVTAPESTAVTDLQATAAVPVAASPSTGRSSTAASSRLVPETADAAAVPPTAPPGTNHIVVPTTVVGTTPNRILVPTAQTTR
jgi:hypothetical protein